MARRTATKNEAEITETVETPTEATEAPATEAPAEVPVDLSAFQAAVNDGMEDADPTTGVPTPVVTEAVNVAYRELESLKAKNAARAWLDQQMLGAVTEQSITKARYFVDLKNGLSAGSAARATKAPADPTEAFVARVAALGLAQDIVTNSVPEGVSDDWSEKVSALVEQVGTQVDDYKAWTEAEGDDKGDEPEVNAVVKAAFKLARGRATSTGGCR